MISMVTSIWFPDAKEFNLFCRLQRLRREEIVNIFYDRGKLLLIIDRDPSEASAWEERKSGFLKELKGR